MAKKKSEPQFRKRSDVPLNDSENTFEDGGLWIRLKDQESVKMAFAHEHGDSLAYRRHFISLKGGDRKAAVFPCLEDLGLPKCPGCEMGNKPSKQYISLVAVDGEARVYGYGPTVDNQFIQHQIAMSEGLSSEEDPDPDELEPLKGKLWRVKRTGKGQNDTRYFVTPLGKEIDTTDVEAEIEEKGLVLTELAGPTDYDEIMALLEGTEIDLDDAVKG